jgi:hypothetical protein
VALIRAAAGALRSGQTLPCVYIAVKAKKYAPFGCHPDPTAHRIYLCDNADNIFPPTDVLFVSARDAAAFAKLADFVAADFAVVVVLEVVPLLVEADAEPLGIVG